MTDPNQIPNDKRPALNRPELRQRLEQQIPLFDFEAFGTWKLVLKHFRVEPGKKNQPYYMATVRIVESDNAAWPADRMANLWFPIGRGPTPTDKFRGEKDDRRLTAFILAVYRIGAGVPFDVEKGLDDLIAMGKIDSDNLIFTYRRLADPYVQKVLHPVTKEVIQEVERTGAKEFFDPVLVAPAA
jgi:hypothetical protein